MARSNVIEHHPRREEIDEALVNGLSINQVSKDFSLNRQTLTRYRNDVLYKRIRKLDPGVLQRQAIAAQQKSITEAADLFKIIMTTVERMQKLSDACDLQLQDPDDPSRYFLGAEEGDVLILGYRVDDEGKTYPVKSSLDKLLKRLEGENVTVTSSPPVSRWNSVQALIKSAETLSRTMDSLVSAWSAVEAQRTNFSASPEWRQITDIITEVIERHPEEREVIGARLRALA